MKDKIIKNAQLRNNEYYVMQEVQDYLYDRSYKQHNFYDLMKFINTDNNIRLAYRNIKTNKGSKTCGISGKNLIMLGKMKLGIYLKRIRKMLLNYQPFKIKRVGIPKKNGKIRYLGIEEPEEKIMEQAIRQILNPICMAKFHNNSNGFIEGRSVKRAISQMEKYILKDKLYYVVDIDIKGFFDNINHGKLLKQLWTLGIKDKNLLSIISKMIKAEILDVGIPDKGTPQGGILSPLLANVALNELDWWLDKKQKLGIKFVRYADDFKILCPTYHKAKIMHKKTINWLKQRLKLQVSEEKTKIVNLKRNYSEFLGFKIKVKIARSGKVRIISHMGDKAKENCKTKLKTQMRQIKKYKNNPKKAKREIELYNSQVIGIQNFYKIASCISYDLRMLELTQNIYIIKNLEYTKGYTGKFKNEYSSLIKRYGGAKELLFIRGSPIAPIGKISNEMVYGESNTNFYLPKSRSKIHKELKLDNGFIIPLILKKPYLDESVEFNDNVLSKFCGQIGKFAITGKMILDTDDLVVVRKNLYNNDDSYNNLMLVNQKIAKLITVKNTKEVSNMGELKAGISSEKIMAINELRKKNKLELI